MELIDAAQIRQAELEEEALRAHRHLVADADARIPLRADGSNDGLCAVCEEPIGDERLAARPDARTCIHCQRELEQAARQFTRARRRA